MSHYYPSTKLPFLPSEASTLVYPAGRLFAGYNTAVALGAARGRQIPASHLLLYDTLRQLHLIPSYISKQSVVDTNTLLSSSCFRFDKKTQVALCICSSVAVVCG